MPQVGVHPVTLCFAHAAMRAWSVLLLCSLHQAVVDAQTECTLAASQLASLNSTVQTQQALIAEHVSAIADVNGILDSQSAAIYRLQVLLREFRNITETTTEPPTTTVGLVQSNQQCMTTNDGLQNCLEIQPPAVCCTVRISGDDDFIACSTRNQCEAQQGFYDETTTLPPTTWTAELTTVAPETTAAVIETTVAPTTMAVTTAMPTTHIQSNEACLTFDGIRNCQTAFPPSVCCTLVQGEEVNSRCSVALQCLDQGGVYPGWDDTTVGTVRTTVPETTMGQTAAATTVPTTSEATTLPPPTTTEAELKNDVCQTSFDGLQNCSGSLPPSVCCLLSIAGNDNVKCATLSQCKQQGGMYPAEPTTLAVTAEKATTLVETTPATATTQVVPTTPFVQSNTACLSTMLGIVNCRQPTAGPPGVCCNLTETTRCADEFLCTLQGGTYPDIVETTSVLETTGPPNTTVAATTTDVAVTTMPDKTTAALLMTTMAETTQPATTLYESTAEWTQSNYRCHTATQGVVDCSRNAPVGVCCTVTFGQFTETRCKTEEQCRLQNGVFEAYSVPTTAAPPTTTLVTETTLVAATTLQIATTAPMLTTVAPTTEEIISTTAHTNCGSSCMTSDQGLMNCKTAIPPGVCCTLLQGEDYFTRCMPSTMCSLQDGFNHQCGNSSTTEAAGMEGGGGPIIGGPTPPPPA